MDSKFLFIKKILFYRAQENIIQNLNTKNIPMIN